MDLRQLRYFVQIVDCGSFSRAAERLRVAQPSLSLQLKGLEAELGVELLVRHPRGVTPTDLGLVFLDHARIVLREAERAKDVVRSRAASPIGAVRVGLPTSACRGLALPLANAMEERLPGVDLHLVEAMTGNLDEWIQMGRLDVALLYDHRAVEHVAWTEMMVEDLMLIVPSAGGYGPGAVAFRDLADHRLVLPGLPNVLRLLLERLAAARGVALTITDCDSLPAIRAFVRAGRATVMPRFAFAEEIERGEMVALPIADPTPSWRLSVVVSERTVNLRASRAAAEVMGEVIADLVGRGEWSAQLSGT